VVQSKLPRVGTTIFARMSALAAECNALNLSQGFPDFEAPETLCTALAEHVQRGHNQYAPMAGVLHLREQLALQLERYRGVTADPETEITVLPGATEGIFCAIMACVNPGVEVIVSDPGDDGYEPAIELAGGRAVHVPRTLPDFSIDWQRVRDAVTKNTSMIVINSPHNPAGSTLSDSDLAELSQLAELHDLLVVSDEVYEHLIYDGLTHHSVLQYPGLRERSFALYSFGKTFSVTGWKTGYCVAAPQLTAELRKVHQFVCFVAVTPVQLAVADFLAAEPDYPGTLAAFYQSKRDLFCSHLAESRFNLVPSSGTYFQLLDYSAITDIQDEALAEQWTREHGIASIPVSVFCEEPPPMRYLRFCFAKNDDVLVTAAETLCAI